MGDHALDCLHDSIDFEFEYADDYHNMQQAALDEKYGTPFMKEPLKEFTVDYLSGNGAIPPDVDLLDLCQLDFFCRKGIEQEVSQVQFSKVETIKLGIPQVQKTIPDFITGDYGGLTDTQIELVVCRIDKRNLSHGELVSLAEHSKKYVIKWNMMVGMVNTVLSGKELSEKQKKWLSTNITEPVDQFPKLCQDVSYRNYIVAMRDHIVRSANYR